MDALILREEEERRYRFRPFSLAFLRPDAWGGALSDIRWLWPWLRPHRRRLAVGFALFAWATAVAVVVPKMVGHVVDHVLIGRSTPALPWLAGLGLLILTKITADLCYKWLLTRTGQSATRDLRRDVFRALGDFPLAFYDRNSSGRLISRCVNDVTNVSGFFTANFFTAVSDMALVLGCSAVLVAMAPWAGLVVLLALAPMTVLMLNVTQAQMHWGRDIRHVLSRLSSHAGDSMNNLAVLHSQPFAARWEGRYHRLQELFGRITTKNIWTWGTFSSAHVLVMGIAYAGVVLTGIQGIREGSLSLGDFIASCTYVSLVFGPFLDISEKLNTLVTALGSVKRLREFLPSGRSAREAVLPAAAGAPPAGPVRFEGVSFAYRPDRPLFTDFSLELPEGEVTALVGRTGSGKTTLGHLLLGLYPVQSGRVLWGEENLLGLPPARRARWVQHVSQDLFLFSDTLRENLRLWREDIEDDTIRERLERVGLWEKVRSLPQGLDTVVKAEILPFSQGEKQLLLLCRALLQDPSLLVFDEATASLDQLTEERWLAQVVELFRGRTTLFIAHRLETLRLASHVAVLESGRLVKSFQKPVGAPVREEDLG